MPGSGGVPGRQYFEDKSRDGTNGDAVDCYAFTTVAR